MKRRLRLLSSNGSLAVCSVIQLTGYDHGVQHVAGELGAFAETGTNDFDRNLGDLGGSGGGAVIVLLHDDFLLKEILFRRPPGRTRRFLSFVLGAYMIELQVMTGKGHREISFDFLQHQKQEKK